MRDWIHADDHSSAVLTILDRGVIGETYLIGADGEQNNRDVVEAILELMGKDRSEYDLVTDRAGARPAVRDRLDASAPRARLGTGIHQLPRGPRINDRVVPRERGLVGGRQGRRRGVLRVEGAVMETTIEGLLLFDLDVRGDNRGWFKENWQREKMTAAGLPDFGPVQNNISFNATTGTTRGIHAEPWDKWVSVATGRIFGAWVDLREGEGFGRVFTAEIGPDRAIFVPRGVGNAFQVLEDNTAYTYLVNDHWSPDASYSFLNLADETVAIDWPISLESAELSEKDRNHPRLADVTPVPPRKILVVGANGQLGRALRSAYEGRSHVEFATREDLDLTSDISNARHWRDYGAIINAGAYTAVDGAETDRAGAWAANATGVASLARVAAANGITLVHVSSDYVFDGSASSYSEDGRSFARGRVRPVEGRWRYRGGHGPAALHRAHVVGDRRGQQFRLHDGVARVARGGSVGRRRPGGPADVHERDRSGHPSPARDRRAVRHIQPHGIGCASLVVRDRAASVRADGARSVARLCGVDGRVLRGEDGHRAAPCEQRARPGQDPGDGFRAGRRR